MTGPHDTTPTNAATIAAKREQSQIAALGRYRIDGVLGTGGMGIVHIAFDLDLERRVAIKLLQPDQTQSGRARLLREARAMARLDHPNVVTIFEVDSIDGIDFVVMEWVDGGSLKSWLAEVPRTEAEILEAFVGAGRGLAAAHAAGMVHRDFKPHNVLRSTRGEVQVTDFGLARESNAPADELEPSASASMSSRLLDLTQAGAIAGTPPYMAPEQWACEPVTPAVDQFAFCVALWEALTGARPYDGPTEDVLRAKIEAGPANLDCTRIPRRLRAVLLRGLDPDPAKRFASMEALLAALSSPTRKSSRGRRAR